MESIRGTSFILILLVYSTAGEILNEYESVHMPALYALDDYEGCFQQRRGPYCLVKLALHDDKPNVLVDVLREHSDFSTQHYNRSVLDRGVCVQSTCAAYPEATGTGAVRARALEACLNASIWSQYGVQASLLALLHCDEHNEPEPVSSQDWTVLIAFLAIIAINVVATCYDALLRYFKQDNGNKYLLSFSLVKSYKSLTFMPDANVEAGSLQFINFFKVVLNFFVILLHVTMVLGTTPSANPQEFEKLYQSVLFRLVINGMMAVQVFFMYSGLLLAQNFLNYSETTPIQWYHVPKSMFLRCCRLSPSLAVVLAFSGTWLRHVGSGPLWNLFVASSVVTDCRTYWWHHLLYINNYVATDKCLIPTWHVATDSQLYLVGALVCALGARARRTALAALLAAGTLLPALHVLLQDLDALVLMYPEFFRTMYNPTYYKAHVLGHCNTQGFLVGMLVAYLAYHYQRKGVDLSKNKYWNWYISASPVLVLVVFYSGQPFYAEGARASLAVRAVYAALHRALLAVLCAPAIIAVMLKAPSSLRWLTEWRGWLPPSRLSYGVYLLHMNLVHILIASRQELVHVSGYNLLIYQCGVFIVSYAMSVPLYLMVEAPVNRFFKTILNSQKPSTKEQNKKIT